MFDICVDKLNNATYVLHFESDEGIGRELSEHFKFRVPGYKFNPDFKMGVWDGFIRLYNRRSHELPSGLIHELIRFSLDFGYKLDIDPDIHLPKKGDESVVDVKEMFNSFNLEFDPYDYQEQAVEKILTSQKRMILSPTSSGKSFILYGAIRALLEEQNRPQRRILLVVPTTSLVEQMCGDFADYSKDNGWDVDKYCHKIYSGKEKRNTSPVTVTTWQSIYKCGKKWFEHFDAVFVDEAHLASASSISSIMDKCVNAEYRIGLTGTIEDSLTHELKLVALFGRILETITTKEMMDKGMVSELTIQAIVIDHDDSVKKAVAAMSYDDEIDTIISDDVKNKFICKLALAQPGNTLILFRFKDRHGIPLCAHLRDLNTRGKTIFYVDGDTPVIEREEIRAYTEEHDDVIIVASYGTFSTGINIKNLQSVIFAHPYKSKIKILQSIGRCLRKSTRSSRATLFDIVSDYKWKSKPNTTLKHFKSRLALYKKAEFIVKMRKLKI